jgi:hypothetical protein
MAKKLTWEEIKQDFDKQWVELIDYDWQETEPYPNSGVVRVHSGNRKEFDKMILQDPPAHSAIIFVGQRKRPDNVILSSNLRSWER